MAGAICRSWPEFRRARFLRGIEEALEPLELKARVSHLADRLERHLPETPREKFPILMGALAVDENDKMGLDSFLVWPLTEIVSRYSDRTADFSVSMLALREMTRRFTSEFAIRPFLIQQPERTLKQLHIWSAHSDEHVRRLVSEGSRPLLPWGERLPFLQADPDITLSLLEKLHADDSEYVRRSVANHLNDLSRAHPERILTVLRSWKKQGHSGFSALSRRALRTMIKNGHEGALAFLGFSSDAPFTLLRVVLASKRVKIGESLGWEMTIFNPGKAPVFLLVDYTIHHRRANGKLAAKVFKGREKLLEPGAEWNLKGSHSFRLVTTRKYYPGGQAFSLLVNGRTFPKIEFSLSP